MELFLNLLTSLWGTPTYKFSEQMYSILSSEKYGILALFSSPVVSIHIHYSKITVTCGLSQT